MGDWTTRVVVRTRRGIVCVKEDGGYWHLPGGKKNHRKTKTHPSDEDWRCTGSRELREETGISVRRESLKHLSKGHNKRGKKQGSRYTLHYCEAYVSEKRIKVELLETGAEGELVRIIPYRKLRIMEDFLPGHLVALRKLKLLGPPRRKYRR